MAALVVFAFVLFFFFLVRAANPKARQVRKFDRLAARGLKGRALVLSAYRLANGVTLGGRRFESRQMTLEVELPGQPPYEISGLFLVPRGQVDPIPGSSLDVAVDRGDAQSLAVLGPGGFSGPWLRVGPPAPY